MSSKPTKLRIPKASDRNANATIVLDTSSTSTTPTGGGGTTLRRQDARTKVSQLKSPGNRAPGRHQSSKKSTTSSTMTGTAPLSGGEAVPPSPPPAPNGFIGPAVIGGGTGGGGGVGGSYRFTQNPYDPVEFTELFCDFPVSYESTAIIGANNFHMNGSVKPLPPPYREPPPPTPPPISQMPSFLLHGAATVGGKRQQQDDATTNAPMNNSNSNSASNSNASSPSRGKVVLSKKERKELIKNNNKSSRARAAAAQAVDNAASDSCEATAPAGQDDGQPNHHPHFHHQRQAHRQPHHQATATEAIVVSETSSPSKQKSPYKGRVTELKNCIAKINSRGLFSALNKTKETPPPTVATTMTMTTMMTTMAVGSTTNLQETMEATSSEEAPPPPSSETSSSPFKNIPVRQRKGGIPPMENYCLFDPSVDFINEKTLKRRRPSDPPSPSPEEFVQEIIYDNEDVDADEDDDEDEDGGPSNPFEHHNYFVIDPDDFEIDPSSIGIPNPFTNEEIITQKLLASKSISLEKVHTSSASGAVEPGEAASALNQSTTSSSKTDDDSSANSGSQANDDTNNNDMMIGSSTSTAASSSSSSGSSTVTKKLSFLNLSPFRSNSLRSNHSDGSGGGGGVDSGGGGGGTGCGGIRSDDVQFRHRTIPIESNYVLFNPGPVPSRNVQYKIRKPRPLSTHSDADSGFLSPCSPDELKFNPAILVLQQCDSVQGYIEIYTDWANYYLDRAKSKKKVTDLSADCRDGLLLADVIEAVTSFKVPDLVKKPKNQQQMYDNVNSCLNVLRNQAVSGLESITTNDICAGRLKAVLALFFALSRYKQQSKQSKSLTGSIKAEIHHQPQPQSQQQLQQQQQLLLPSNNHNQSATNANVITAQQSQNGNDAMINR